VIRRILRTTIMVLLAPALLLALGEAAAQTPEEIFIRGNAAYEQGDYIEAVAAYRTVLKYRIHDPRVEYNLGNAEFRLGHLGEAILHYERARRLDPTDPDINANLEFARTQCFDRVEQPELLPAVRWVRDLQDRTGPDRQAWVLLILIWGIALLLCAGLLRPGVWHPLHGWILAALVLVLLLGAASWHATYQRLEGRRAAVVLDQVVEVLAGPGESNPTLFTVHEGLTLEVRSERESWIQVSLPNGLNGWISAGSVGLI
jgi:tetratricopeptide (TPR) repeat protein